MTDGGWDPNEEIRFTVTEPYMGLAAGGFVLQHIGRITLILADTDDTLAACAGPLGLSGPHAKKFIRQPLSEKARLLKETTPAPPPGVEPALLLEIVSLIQKTIPRRNYAVHGTWGFYIIDDETKRTRPGAFCKDRRTEPPFYAEEILTLHEEIVTLNHRVHQLFNTLNGFPGRDPDADRPPFVYFASAEQAQRITGLPTSAA